MSLLEVGKRLLLLRELTPRGEFDQRLEMIGFPRSSAYRFMQAARKTLKSPTVRLLAEQVKNRKAFLELITHDDDADIEAVAQLDDIERMSASQLRAALREAKAEREAQDRRLDAKQRRIDALEHEAERASARRDADPAAARAERFEDEATSCALDVLRAIARLRDVCEAYAGECDDHCIPEPQRRRISGLAADGSEQLHLVREGYMLDAITPTDEEARAEAAEFIAWKAAQDAAQSGGAADESVAD